MLELALFFIENVMLINRTETALYYWKFLNSSLIFAAVLCCTEMQ